MFGVPIPQSEPYEEFCKIMKEIEKNFIKNTLQISSYYINCLYV